MKRSSLHRNSLQSDENPTRDVPETSSLSLGSVGSRRTVYLAENDTENLNNQQTQPPLLVYNRISTVLGDVRKTTNEEQVETKENNCAKKEVDCSKETAVWYEYGCV